MHFLLRLTLLFECPSHLLGIHLLAKEVMKDVDVFLSSRNHFVDVLWGEDQRVVEVNELQITFFEISVRLCMKFSTVR